MTQGVMFLLTAAKSSAMNLDSMTLLSLELRRFVIGRVEIENDPGSNVPVDCCQVIHAEAGLCISPQIQATC